MVSRQQSRPFVTRTNTLGFFLVAVVSLWLAAGAGDDAWGVLVTAVSLVTGAVAWICGVVIAASTRSMLWLFGAVLFPIVGALCAAIGPIDERRR